MKQACKDYALRLMVLLVLVLVCALLVLGVRTELRRNGKSLELPPASEVVACYYIPDVADPYEQTWLGGEALETVLSELSEVVFVLADEPDGGKMVSCLVIATNKEQITVHVDEDGRAWVYEMGWLKSVEMVRCGG